MAFNLNLFGTLLILTVVCSALIYGNIFHHKYCMLIFNFLGLKHGEFKCLSSDNFSEVLHTCMPSELNFSFVTINKENHYILGFHCIKGSIGNLAIFHFSVH